MTAPRPLGRAAEILVRTVAPIVLALVAGGVIICALGVNPLEFYASVVAYGVGGDGWQQTLTAMAPLMLVALGLIIAFRAQLWNLGYAGAYLLSAVVVSGVAPDVFAALPYGIGLVVLLVLALAVGAVLAVLPAWLKNRYGTTEIVTSLMVSFVALSAANLLVKGIFRDKSVTLPQTRVLDQFFMLPYIPGTRVHVGVVVALVLVIVFHLVLKYSAFGMRVDVYGASPRAAVHAGINVKRLVTVVLLLSSGMIALGAAVDMLGLWGYVRADWNPGYGDKILPFVFLARQNPLGSVPLVAVYAVLATGGTVAAQQAGLSVDFLLVIVALILFFMVAIEALGRRGGLGRSYLGRRGSRVRRGLLAQRGANGGAR